MMISASLLQALQYYGAAAGTVAALIVSLDLGRIWTGWGFAIFVTSSMALLAWGFLDADSEGIGVQNVVLLGINCIGVWRYLLSKRGVKAATSPLDAGRGRGRNSPHPDQNARNPGLSWGFRRE